MITWEKQAQQYGIFVEFKIMHGDADLFTSEQILVLDDKELEECIVFANNLKKGYKDNYWIHYDDEDENISLTKMGEIIQKETSLDISKIKNWLEKLMKEDISGARDTYAEVVAYRIKKVAEYISKKTNYSADEIMDVIENIVKSDVKFDEHMAQMSYFEVFKYENGTIQKLEL